MDTDVRFATLAGARVAYQVHGEGDLDIVYSPGLASHLDLTMEQPRYRHFVELLTRYGRVIRFDRRGSGVSDPVPPDGGESWEMWVDDLTAVLDATGSGRAAILATNDAGAAGVLFAAGRPDRTAALVLFNTTARFTQAPDYPAGHPPEVADLVVGVLREQWGTEAGAALLAPSLQADEQHRRWYARFQRGACPPAEMAASMERTLRMDARHVLPEVRCPTLVLHRSGYTTVPLDQGRYLADHIPGATFLEVEGADATIYTEGVDATTEAIGRFLGVAPRPVPDGRQFTTVLFTDIVGSTERAVALGDRRWHALLEAHDAEVRRAVGVAGGSVVKTTGDGILATFDAPSRAIQCGLDSRRALEALDITVRAGVHAGPVVRRPDGDITGVAVNVAARVLGVAGAGEVLVTSAVVDLLTGDALSFEDRGVHPLKGIPDPVALLAVA